MTGKKKSLSALAALGSLIALFAAITAASYAPAGDATADPVNGPLGYAWRGAIHVHSSVSDGAGGIDEIMSAAEEAGLDFVVVSDHNPFAAGRPRAGWYGNVLLIVAEEISTLEGHLLALQVGGHRYRFGPTARQALADIHDEGGWALVAHPDHERQSWHGGWGGTEGLEVANLASAWSRQGSLSAAATILASLIDSDYAATRLLRSAWPALQIWDTLLALDREGKVVRRRVAVGSADSHGPVIGSMPAYVDTLSVLSTLIWIRQSPAQARQGDARALEAELLGALRAGRAAVEVTAIGDARAFSFVATSSGATAAMGELAAAERGPWSLRVTFESPVDSEIRLLRDGEEVLVTTEPSIDSRAAGPGTYRVAVYRQDLATGGGPGPPWLISNPIYVWPAEARAAARVRRAPPLPAPALSRNLLAASSFGDDSRGVARNSVRATADVVSWELTLEPESDREAFAAMAWRPEEPLDWSDAEGVVVGLRARQPLRINLEVRTYDGTGRSESWVATLKVEPETAAEAIPWSRFRPPWGTDPGESGAGAPRRAMAADISQVHAVFFIVSPALLAPGSDAEIELEVLGLFGGR